MTNEVEEEMDEIVPENDPEPPAQPTFSPAPALTSEPKPKRKFLTCAVGCLAALLILIIVIPIFHVLVLRPYIERQIIEYAINEANKYIEISEWNVDLTYANVSEDDLNDALEEIWQDIPIITVQDGWVDFQQDLLVAGIKVFGIKFQVSVDIRVDADGGIVLKSIELDFPLNLFFTEAGLRDALENYANEEVIEPSNLEFKAFQVSDGELFVVYESRR